MFHFMDDPNPDLIVIPALLFFVLNATAIVPTLPASGAALAAAVHLRRK